MTASTRGPSTDEPSGRTAAASYGAVFAEVARMEQDATAAVDEIRLLFLRNITIEGLDTFVKYHLYQAGVRARIEIGGYGTMTQDVLAPDALAARTEPELIVLALALEELDPTYGLPRWTSDLARAELEALFELLANNTRATIAIHTFIAPPYPELGLVVHPQGADLGSQVAALNRFVVEFVRERAPRFCLMDWDRYVRLLGYDAAIDHRSRYLWSAPFRRAFLDTFARHIASVGRALKGKVKKCVVLDCDNTLWGGIVGEDGIDGIKLDHTQYPGRAFADFQSSLLHLHERGVLIAICSKNNEADVFEVLDGHPGSRLKRLHLAAWRINWEDKASNLIQLAEELNLGLDSFVFVDDNPVECGLIRKVLPQVTVVQIPDKLHELPHLLLKDGLFDTLRITDEDRQRQRLYAGEAERRNVRREYASIDDYLRSLETVAVIHRARHDEIPRVAQLTQKTNQFNVTTRRYSEQDIRAFVDSPRFEVFSLTARDRLGSLGLVGVMIFELRDGIGRIDTFLMSCRALGRRLEDAMVAHCLHTVANAHRIDAWQAEYVATNKNGQVADLWPRLGFSPMGGTGVGRNYRRAADAAPDLPPTHVLVVED